LTEIRNLAQLAEYANEQIQRIAKMQSDLAGSAGRGQGPRGMVRARTGPGGKLLGLRIDPEALRLSAEQVTAEVAAAISAAQKDYSRHADEIMAPVLGMRPSEQSVADIERGLGQLDVLAEDMERLARNHDLLEPRSPQPHR
jgi:DNA-binding protein YbaB